MTKTLKIFILLIGFSLASLESDEAAIGKCVAFIRGAAVPSS